MAPRSELPRVREAITAAGVAGTTVPALMSTLGISESTARVHVATLRRQGFLAEDNEQHAGAPGRPRRRLIDRRFR